MNTKKAVFLALALLVALAALPWQRAAAEPKRYYVTQTGTGSGIGGWGAASSDLKGIMDSAGSGDEIWVAKGTYSPGDQLDYTFNLKKGVKVYGGFAGNEASVDARDWVTNVTTLDGGNNVYHVVTGEMDATPADTRLDGFTITGGKANGSNDDAHGGGMYNANSSPTVANCVFSGNTADVQGGGMYNANSSLTVANCVFTGNTAVGDGGGMCNSSNSSPKVENCTFSGNMSNQEGGGMHNWNDSSPTVVNCTFSDNEASLGGGMNNKSSSPAVENCVFSGNTAEGGGGMYNWMDSSPTVEGCAFSGNTANMNGGGMGNTDSNPTVVNCTFSGNTANMNGGGMDNSNSSPTVVNCTFSKNTAVIQGGGMFNYYNSSPTVANTILWGNDATGFSNSADIYQDGSTLTLKNCVVDVNNKCLFVNDPTRIESGLINENPMLIALDRAGNEVTNPEESANRAKVYIYGLGGSSSAKNKGLPVGTVIKNDIRVPATDQRGVPRKPAPAAVDIGAYEAVDFYTITNKLTHITSSNPAAYRLTSDTTDYQATLTAAQGYTLPADITVKVGGTALTTGYTYNSSTGALSIDAASITGNIEIEATAVAPIAVTGVSLNKTITALTVGNSETLTATVEPADASNKAVTWVSDKPAIATVNNGVVTGKALGKAVITVTTQDGSFQATCTVIVRGTEPKIWYVKEGGAGNRDASDWDNAAANLKDIMDIANSGDQVWVAKGTYSPGGDVTDTFLLKQGVKVYGGFVGDETNLSARNWVTNVTTLNGNSTNWHVVTGQGGATSDDTRLDGFTITGGKANENGGGGMYNYNSSPTVANCTFSGNTAYRSGGGMCNNGSSPTVTNCTFTGNTTENGAKGGGGGMHNVNSNPTVEKLRLLRQTRHALVTRKAAGCLMMGPSPTVTNCAFTGNEASNGGGMCNANSSPKVTNCTLLPATATRRPPAVGCTTMSPARR
ncbi:MAG: right-handed parallel beta-helix repeat-containing protein [Christensenellales bacterium]